MKHYNSHISQSSQSRSQAIWPAAVCFKGKFANTGFNDAESW
jgi:hypothetical protein